MRVALHNVCQMKWRVVWCPLVVIRFAVLTQICA